MMAALEAVLFLVLLRAAALGAEDADYPIHCPRDDKLEACLGQAIQTIVRRFRPGLPEVGIPSVDPLTFPEIDIKKKEGSIMDIHLTYVDLVVKDITINATVTSVQFKPEKFDLLVTTHRPLAHFNGKYTTKGKLLWLPIWGSGNFAFTMYDIVDTFRISGKGITKEDGKLYWEVTNFHASLQPKKMTLNFENLYDGNRLMALAAHRLINGQWSLFYQRLKAWSDEAYSDTMKPHWRNLFLLRPFDEIFPAPN